MKYLSQICILLLLVIPLFLWIGTYLLPDSFSLAVRLLFLFDLILICISFAFFLIMWRLGELKTAGYIIFSVLFSFVAIYLILLYSPFHH